MELTDKQRGYLIAAAYEIEHCGIIHGTGEGANGELCVLGALSKVVTGKAGNWYKFESAHVGKQRKFRRLVNAIGDQFDTAGANAHSRIINWNDGLALSDGSIHSRTAAEAAAKLREIAYS